MTDVQATWQRGRVVATEPAADGIRRIEIETDLAVRAEPGSHVDVRIGREIKDVRSYSIADASPDGRRLTLGIHLSPTSRGGSSHMHSLTAGDDVELTTPLQNFPLRVGAQRYVLLAGGVGITAIAATAATLRRVGADYTLVFAAR
ncbi:MAG TPA: oxidoreductase, partial [Aldersonia sp.]